MGAGRSQWLWMLSEDRWATSQVSVGAALGLGPAGCWRVAHCIQCIAYHEHQPY